MFLVAHDGEVTPDAGLVMTDWGILVDKRCADRERQTEEADVEPLEPGAFNLSNRPGP